MRVRLTRKFAERIDGVDLSNFAVGDVIDLPEAKARSLVAEGWGEFEPRRSTAAAHKVLTFPRDTEHNRLEPGQDDVSRAS